MDTTRPNRFDIKDPSATPSTPAPSAVESDVETAEAPAVNETEPTAGDTVADAPKGKASAPRSAPAKPAEKEIDLSDYLDELAGKQIAALTKRIGELESALKGAPAPEPRAEKTAEAPAKPDQGSDRVARRQSQFISRTSSRDGNALSPEERAHRSVEELMRKRNLL